MARILIIENDNEVGSIFSEWLRRGDHHVDHATTARGALLRATETTYDLMLLDVILTPHGESDGLVVGLAMRALGYEGPIVLVTGAVPQIDDALAGPLKIAGVLRKPLMRGDDLVDEVEKHLKGPNDVRSL